MTEFRVKIDVLADSEDEARAYFDAAAPFGGGGTLRAARINGQVLWAAELENDVEGGTLGEVQDMLDALKLAQSAPGENPAS